MNKQRTRGQALLEFALVSPILLLLLSGILDFSRVFITYALASNSLRDGLRLAAVLGYDENDAQYADCDSMRDAIRQTIFVAAPTINIQYQKANDLSIIPCNGSNLNPNLLVSGDMLQIDVQTNVSLLTPLLNNLVPNLPIHFEGQRTIVSYISLPNRYSVDRDFDGLLDAWETANFGNISLTGTDDPDFDRCNNGCEESRGTNPNVADTDGDNLLDGEEAYIYQTNPLLQDTDGDGLNDDAEIACGTAPVSIDGVPSDSRDTDSDGVWDHIECGWGLPWAPGADFDGDGLNDAQEIAYGTIPYNPDSDGDTISDGAEVYGSPATNPTLADSDSDDLRDDVELARGTNPNDPDTDGDGLPDGQEANAASTRFGRTPTPVR